MASPPLERHTTRAADAVKEISTFGRFYTRVTSIVGMTAAVQGRCLIPSLACELHSDRIVASFASTEDVRGIAEPTLTDAIDRVVDAAHGLVDDEIALAQANLETAMVATFTGGLLVVIGACLGLGAWTALMVAADGVLKLYVSPLLSLLVIAAVNAIAAAAFVGGGRASLQRPSATATGNRR
jgi:hypothetical protein